MQTLLILTIVLLQYTEGSEIPCKPPAGRPGCVCDIGDKGAIDLTSLATTNRPKYVHVYTPLNIVLIIL